MKKAIAILLTAALLCSFAIVVSARVADDEYLASDKWQISVSSDRGGTVRKMIDNEETSYWHSNYVAEGGVIKSHDEAPFTVIVTFPTVRPIAGVRYLPRQVFGTDNSSAGIISSISVYASSDGQNYTHVADGTHTYANAGDRNSWDVLFDTVSAKAMKIIFSDGVGGYGTCGELKFIKSDISDPDDDPTLAYVRNIGKNIVAAPVVPKAASSKDAYPYSTAWQITASSAFNANGVGNMFDRDPSTYWHSYYTAANGNITGKDDGPFDITIEFPYSKWVSGVRYLPRQDQNSTGTAYILQVLGSTDGKDFTEIKRATFNYTTYKEEQTMRFNEVEVKAICVRILDSQGGYGTCAELEVLRGKSDTSLGAQAQKTVEEKETVTIVEKTTTMPQITPKGSAEGDTIPYAAGWVVEATSATSAANIGEMFDRNPNTRWHSWYKTEGTEVTESSPAPYDFFVTFPEPETISGVRYTPRPDSHTTGIALKAEVYGSEDGINFVLLGEGTYSYGNGYARRDKQTISFDDVTLKTVCYRITDTGGNHGTAAELEFIRGDYTEAVDVTEYMKVNEKKVGKITLTIDSCEADNDGVPVTLIAPATIVNSRTLVPIRFVSEALGANVTWDERTRKVGITSADYGIELMIDSNRASVNGRNYLLDTPACLMNNSTMVPIRFVSEALGAQVEWLETERQVVIRYKKSIAIWGDGLAVSAGNISESVADVLYRLSGGIKTVAYGGENEDALSVAARQGAYDVVLTEPVTIPQSGKVAINIALADGRKIVPRTGTDGWNPCMIGNISGVIMFDVDYTVSPRALRGAWFIRSSSGAAAQMAAGTKVTPLSAGASADINIFMLENRAQNRLSPDELVAVLRDMIVHTGNKEKYVVVGPIEGTAEELAPYETALSSAFGEKFLNVREKMLEGSAWKDYDIVLTEDEQAEVEQGMIPLSLLRGKNDRCHFNDHGYDFLGALLCNKLEALSYIAK